MWIDALVATGEFNRAGHSQPVIERRDCSVHRFIDQGYSRPLIHAFDIQCQRITFRPLDWQG